MNIFGIAGWKNNGKTTLLERLVQELSARGYVVSTVKHAHHAFDIDQPGRDSYRHRTAGAQEVLISSANRWALIHELQGSDEPDLSELLSRLSPCDLVLVEGFKRSAHPKIEVHRSAAGTGLLAPDDQSIKAIAADVPLQTDLPCFDLNDIAQITSFILREAGLDSHLAMLDNA